MGKVINLKEAIKIREKMRERGGKVVFTNGCFDIIHRGHIEVLKKAKQLGDMLVVGLNSDKSVKLIKDEKRPIMNEENRALILSSLVFVDYVVLFDEPTPLNLIKTIKPDILVKGGDYKKEEVVGRDVVEKESGEVVIVDKLAGYSTTEIIDKILKMTKSE